MAVLVSNLPEGVAGTISLQAEGFSRRKILLMWTALVAASAVEAGAMLTMLADTMMPKAFKHGGKIVGLLTVAGYLMVILLSVLD